LLLSGKGTATLAFVAADGTRPITQDFEVKSKQSAYLTAPFGAALLTLFFLMGYVDSNLRALRRGKRQITSVVGLTIVAIPIGVAVSVLAWATTGREPTPAGLAVTAAVAAAAGAAAGWGGFRSGRRRQYKRREAAKAKAAAGA
jgi:serine/threonine-protein kinase